MVVYLPQCWLAFALYVGDRGSKHSPAINRPKSLEQVVTEHVPQLRCECHGGPHRWS